MLLYTTDHVRNVRNITVLYEIMTVVEVAVTLATTILNVFNKKYLNYTVHVSKIVLEQVGF